MVHKLDLLLLELIGLEQKLVGEELCTKHQSVFRYVGSQIFDRCLHKILEGWKILPQDCRVELIHNTQGVNSIELTKPIFIIEHRHHIILQEFFLICLESVQILEIDKVVVLCLADDLLLESFVFLDSSILVAFLKSIEFLWSLFSWWLLLCLLLVL